MNTSTVPNDISSLETEAAKLERRVPITPEIEAKHKRYNLLNRRESDIKGEKDVIKGEIAESLGDDMMYFDPKTGKSLFGYNKSSSTSVNAPMLQAFLEAHGKSIKDFQTTKPTKSFFSAK